MSESAKQRLGPPPRKAKTPPPRKSAQGERAIAAKPPARTRSSKDQDPGTKIKALRPENPELTDTLPAVLDALELIAADLPEPPQLVRGILHRGSKMVIGGGSKSFKTWTLVDLAISVAAGVPWWGFDTEQGRVLYMNFEIQDVFFADRLNQVLDAKGCEVADDQLLYWGLRGKASDLGKLMPEMVRKLAPRDLSLIVFDPIYKGLGSRDENKAGDIATLLNELESLAVETGAAIAFGHHFSKGNQSGKESIDRIGGSGVFTRDPDTILTMTKHEQDEAFSVEAILRNFPPVNPFVVMRQHPLMVRDDKLDPADLKKKPGAPQQIYSDEALLSLLDAEPLTTGAWQKKAYEDLGISSAAFMARMRQFKSDGLAHKAGKEWLRVVGPMPAAA